MYYQDRDGRHYHKRSRPFPHVVNATGAGDAAMAGIIFATLQELPPEEHLDWAIGASLLALMSPDTISQDMNIAHVKKMIKEHVL